MPVRDAGRRSGCVCETAPGASADVRRRKPSGVAVANPPQTGCSRPLSTSTEGKASRRPGELRSDLLGEKSGVGDLLALEDPELADMDLAPLYVSYAASRAAITWG